MLETTERLTPRISPSTRPSPCSGLSFPARPSATLGGACAAARRGQPARRLGAACLRGSRRGQPAWRAVAALAELPYVRGLRNCCARLARAACRRSRSAWPRVPGAARLARGRRGSLVRRPGTRRGQLCPRRGCVRRTVQPTRSPSPPFARAASRREFRRRAIVVAVQQGLRRSRRRRGELHLPRFTLRLPHAQVAKPSPRPRHRSPALVVVLVPRTYPHPRVHSVSSRFK